MKIALVRVLPFQNSARVCRLRKWIPVYWPPHCDPDLSPVAAQPHCHIAFNRLPMKYRRWNAIYSAVYVRDILEKKFSKKPLPIISPPVSWKNLPWMHKQAFQSFIERCNEAHLSVDV